MQGLLPRFDTPQPAIRLPHLLAFRVQGSGFRVQGSGFRVQGSGFRVQGSGSRVQGPGFRVQGSGFRVQIAYSCSFIWTGHRRIPTIYGINEGARRRFSALLPRPPTGCSSPLPEEEQITFSASFIWTGYRRIPTICGVKEGARKRSSATLRRSLEGFVASKFRGLCDQICTTSGPVVDCVRRVDF